MMEIWGEARYAAPTLRLPIRGWLAIGCRSNLRRCAGGGGVRRVMSLIVVEAAPEFGSRADRVSSAEIADIPYLRSHAAYFLQEQDMTRYDAVNYISHGIAKRAGASDSRRPKGADQDREERGDGGGGEAKEGRSKKTKHSRPIASTSTRRRPKARSIR